MPSWATESGCCCANPGFTFVAVMTLATGIGANCLVFSVVDSVLLRPFPYPPFDRLTFVWGSDLTGGARYMSSFPNFLAWKSQSRVFEDAPKWRPSMILRK